MSATWESRREKGVRNTARGEIGMMRQIGQCRAVGIPVGERRGCAGCIEKRCGAKT
jgi:hypothetical protein